MPDLPDSTFEALRKENHRLAERDVLELLIWAVQTFFIVFFLQLQIWITLGYHFVKYHSTISRNIMSLSLPRPLPFSPEPGEGGEGWMGACCRFRSFPQRIRQHFSKGRKRLISLDFIRPTVSGAQALHTFLSTLRITAQGSSLPLGIVQ